MIFVIIATASYSNLEIFGLLVDFYQAINAAAAHSSLEIFTMYSYSIGDLLISVKL